MALSVGFVFHIPHTFRVISVCCPGPLWLCSLCADTSPGALWPQIPLGRWFPALGLPGLPLCCSFFSARTCFLGSKCPRSCSAPSFPRSFASSLLLRKGTCLRMCLFWPHVDLSCGREQPSRVTAAPWTCEAFCPGPPLPCRCGYVRGPGVPSLYTRGPSPALSGSSGLSLALACYIS